MNIVDQLKEVVSLNWTDEDYGQSKHKADYKKQLANIYQLLRLYYVRALPNWDVAEKIDTSVPTMYRILRKGKERLAKIL